MNYFTETEFKCNCGCDIAVVDAEFLNMLNVARWKYVWAIHVVSGYRCEAWNTTVGGSWTSSHLKGLAADIEAIGSANRMQLVSALVYAGFNRIGIAERFIHVDHDPDKPANVLWLYPKEKEVLNGQTA